MNELKACPFCGSDAEFQNPNPEPTNAASSEYYVECLGCGATSGTYDFMDEAVKAWNTRTPEWISVDDRLPELNQDGNQFYCTLENITGTWVEVLTWYNPLDEGFEAVTEDEKPFFMLQGDYENTSTKITAWMLYIIPEPFVNDRNKQNKTSLFEDLGAALNPNIVQTAKPAPPEVSG